MIAGIAIGIALAALAAAAYLAISRRSERNQFRMETGNLESRLRGEIQDARQERDLLLDALGDAFLLIGSAGEIRFANAAARELCGPREPLNRPFREVFPDARLAKALLHCLATGDAAQARVVLPQQVSPRGDAENRGVNAWIIDAARLDCPSGSAPVTRVIIRDVTAEHQLEQVRKDFVANASHELRTPLAIIGGYLENLLDEDMPLDPALTRRFLGVMQKHTGRISRIVEDMLVISRLESGEAAALKIEPFRFRSCVNDILERLESVISGQGAEVTVTIPEPDLVMRADRFYWTQVLFNLVENALKQNPHGGLRVEIGCIATPGNRLEIWVADNGVGIPSADLPYIFRRFFRVEKHHSQQEIKGTGLGLSIVKRAIEAHGGTIGVTSVPGVETKFLISVPRETA